MKGEERKQEEYDGTVSRIGEGNSKGRGEEKGQSEGRRRWGPVKGKN